MVKSKKSITFAADLKIKNNAIMSYEEFLQLEKERQLQIFNEFACLNFRNGKKCEFDRTMRGYSDVHQVDFEYFLKTINK